MFDIILFHSKVLTILWPCTYRNVVYLLNKLSSNVLQNHSPYDLLYQKQYDPSLLKLFGCLCFPCLRDYIKNKMQPRFIECVFIGYAYKHKVFLCFDIYGVKFLSTDMLLL